MNLSRRQLYAAGEAFGDCATVRLPGGGVRCGGGGGGSSSSASDTTTTNIDKRVAVSDGIGISGDGNSTSYSYNSSDAVIALADAGADIIKESGGAVVELAKFQGEQNTEAWNTTITQGAKLIDKLIEKTGEGFALSSKVVDSFTPAENKNTEAIKWAAVAAGVVGVGYLFKGKK